MAKNTEIFVATTGFGAGRTYYKDALIDHLAHQGYSQITPIDIASYQNRMEQFVIATGYQVASRFPRMFRLLRNGMYDKGRGPKSINWDKLRADIPVGSTVLSVSPEACRAVTKLPGVAVYHALGDRGALFADASKGVLGVAIPHRQIVNKERLAHVRTKVIGGVLHPSSLMEVDYKEKRKRLAYDAAPNVLFSVTGAGGLGRTRQVVQQLARHVRDERIVLGVYVGAKSNDEMDAVIAAQRAHVPMRYSTGADAIAGFVNIIYDDDQRVAARMRSRAIPWADIVITPTANELSNGPWPVVTFAGTPRSDFEVANLAFGRKKGWIETVGESVGSTVSALLEGKGKNPTRAQYMLDIARTYNDPHAAQRFIGWVKP